MAVTRTLHLTLLILTVIAIAQLESGAGELTNGDYYATIIQGGGYGAPFGYRPGSATRTNSCQHVREVPPHIRSADVMKPWGLSSFYKKYTESYGIPVLAGHNVPDDALMRACYTLRFLLAGNSAVRESFYRYSGRVAVIGRDEGITSIPEYSSLPFWWNLRARGLEATPLYPVASVGEENILCYWRDRYSDLDILLHQMAHGVHFLGAEPGIPGWDLRLRSLFVESESRGLWANTLSMASPEEYFALGVQSYFNCNFFPAVPAGVKCPINTEAKLRTYDPKLYSLIQEVFPCDNIYLQRCESSRVDEDAQRLHMDCDTAAESSDEVKEDAQRLYLDCDTAAESSDRDPFLRKRTMRFVANTLSTLYEFAVLLVDLLLRSALEVVTILRDSECIDKDENCVYWASTNCCTIYAPYMHMNCRRSCNLCNTECIDNHQNCAHWASINACTTHAEYMQVYCRRSCNLCYTECIDNHENCVHWASINACTTHAAYMQIYCRRSCNICNTGVLACTDYNPYCPAWALSGACQTHSAYMGNNCRKSCELC